MFYNFPQFFFFPETVFVSLPNFHSALEHNQPAEVAKLQLQEPQMSGRSHDDFMLTMMLLYKWHELSKLHHDKRLQMVFGI